MCMDVILCVRDGRQFLLSQRKTFSSACFNINIHVIYKTNKHSPYKATPINNSLTRIKPNRWINQRNSPSASLYFLLQAVDSELTYIISAHKETKNVRTHVCIIVRFDAVRGRLYRWTVVILSVHLPASTS